MSGYERQFSFLIASAPYKSYSLGNSVPYFFFHASVLKMLFLWSKGDSFLHTVTLVSQLYNKVVKEGGSSCFRRDPFETDEKGF